jgi:hypothetical protein
MDCVVRPRHRRRGTHNLEMEMFLIIYECFRHDHGLDREAGLLVANSAINWLRGHIKGPVQKSRWWTGWTLQNG